MDSLLCEASSGPVYRATYTPTFELEVTGDTLCPLLHELPTPTEREAVLRVQHWSGASCLPRMKALRREAQCLARLGAHANCVELLGVALLPARGVVLATQYVNGSCLLEHLPLQAVSEALSALLGVANGTCCPLVCRGIGNFSRCCALGLRHMHSHSFVHGALSAASVLREHSGRVRLHSFKACRDEAALEYDGAVERAATVLTAPELHAPHTQPTREGDIYAFGVLIHQVCAVACPHSLRLPALSRVCLSMCSFAPYSF